MSKLSINPFEVLKACCVSKWWPNMKEGWQKGSNKNKYYETLQDLKGKILVSKSNLHLKGVLFLGFLSTYQTSVINSGWVLTNAF